MTNKFQQTEISETGQNTKGRSMNFLGGVVLCLLTAGPALAGPEGGAVVGGEGTISTNGGTTTINQGSNHVAIDWDTFNVASDEVVRFIQPSDTATALNRIFDQNPSQIFGVIEANGRVILINPNGMMFGASAKINVAALVASSLSISVEDFMSGNYTLESSGEGGLILNQGEITTDSGGFVALIGEAVSNEGLIIADAGVVELASGRKVTIDFDGAGLMFFESDSDILESALDVDTAVNNSGTIVADGGRVLLTASAARDVYTQAINNEGVIQARRIDNSGGEIRLSGGDGVTLNSGVLDASGDSASDGGSVQVLGRHVGLLGDGSINASGGANGGRVLVGGAFQGGDASIQNAERTFVSSGTQISADAGNAGDGGEVIVWADDITRYYGSISARGGAESGDGGFVEVSGKGHLDFDGDVVTSAANGQTGTLLLDPTDIFIINGIDGTGDQDPNVVDPDPQLAFADADTTANSVSVGRLQALGDTNITLQATNTITVGDSVGGAADVDLSATLTTSTNTLTLSAGNGTGGAGDVIFNTGSSITTGGGGVTINAGQNGDTSGNAVLGAIDTNGGALTVNAIGSVVVGAAIDTGAGNLDIRVDSDDDSAETLSVLGTLAGGAVQLSGSAVGANDTLQAGDGTNTWTVDTADAGTLNGDAFNDFANLTGGAGADGFTFNDALSGTASGGAGDDTFALNDGGSAGTIDGGDDNDTQTYAGSTGPVTIAVDGLTNIETVIGSGDAGDILQGTAGADTFDVNLADEGTVAGVAFQGFENLEGLGGDDTFNLNAALTGTVDGGANNDSININAGGSAGSFVGGTGLDSLATAGGDDAFVVDALDEGTVNTIDFTGIENLSGGAGADTFDLQADVTGNVDGGADADTINLTRGVTVSGTLTGGTGGTDSDTLVFVDIVGDQTNNWTIDSADGGSIETQAFTEMENLTGNGEDDVFVFTAALTGTASGEGEADIFDIRDGGSAGTFDGGLGSDTQTYENATGPVTISVGDLTAIETLIGSGDLGDTLQGTTGGDTFDVNLADEGTVAGVAFQGFENLDGLAGDDTFNLNAALTGTVAGGADNDTININTGGSAALYDGGTGSDTLSENQGGDDDFIINALNGGTVNTVTFTGVENLSGNAGADTFTFTAALTGTASGGTQDDVFNINDGGSAGAIDGGLGNDTQSYAGSTGPVTVTIVGLNSIETLVGSGDAGDTLQGTTGGDTFDVNLADEGTVGGIAFQGFENLDGLAGDDTFNLNAALTGTVAGGADNDTININAGGSAALYDGGTGSDTLSENQGGDDDFIINALNGGTVNTVAFAGIENLSGNAGADTFTFTAALTGTASGGADNDVFDIRDGGDAGTFDGGLGSDTQTYALSTGPVTISVGDLTAVETLIGSGDLGDTLQGTTGGDTFDVNLADEGTVAGVAFQGFENLDGLAGDDTFNLNAALTGTVAGGADNDTININTGGSAALYDGGTGSDTLSENQGGDDDFVVNALNAGTVNTVAFTGIENLSGNVGADTFTFTAALTGTASGGADNDVFDIRDGGDAGTFDGGVGSDTQTYALSTGPVTISVGDLTAVETLIGSGNTGDTLQGTTGGDTFDVNLADQGTVAGVAFQGFENLDGLAGDDTFNLNAVMTGSVAGGADDDTININAGGNAASYDGGTGTDTLSANAGGDDAFVVNALNAGTANGTAFTGVENLSGNAGVDTFTFNAALTGTASGGAGDDLFEINDGGSASILDGGADNDTQSYAGSTGPVTVDVDDLTSIETVVGSGDAGDTLQATAGDDTFDITAANSGTVAGVAFQDFENLDGQDGDDTFDLSAGGSVSSMSGGGDSDLIVTGAGDDIFVVNAADAGTANGIAFDSVENLSSGAGNDTFNLDAALSGTISAGDDDDTVNVNDGGSALSMDGGAGNDVVSYAAMTAGATINSNAFVNFESIVGSSLADTINLNGDQGDDLTVDAGAGDDTINLSSNQGGGLTVVGGAGNDGFVVATASTIGGDLNVNGVESAAINADVDATNVTLDVAGVVTSAGGTIAGQALSVTSVGGQSLDTSVGTFTASNSGGGSISLSNSGALDVQDVSQAGSDDITIVADGEMTQSGDISTNGGNVIVSATNGGLTMADGTTTSSTGGDITYSTDGSGGDITLGTLTTCAAAFCTTTDSGVVTVSSTSGDIVGNNNASHITADTAVVDSDGNIGISLDDPLVFTGMLTDVPRISISFNGFAFVDSSGAIVDVTSGNLSNFTNSDDVRKETAASAQAAALEEDTSVDWAAYSEDVTVYEVNNEGVQLPKDQQDDEFARLREQELVEEAPVPLSQLIGTH